MSIEDIKGYKPHTEDKIGKVNAIKDAEVRLGLILDALLDEALLCKEDESHDDTVEDMKAVEHLTIAKERLKEASMWACRAVFRPEEKY
ncbi:conserved hypothetical protein [Edwardsiella phage PEi26]|uniref:Acb2/Tad1 hairpin domain-containing protein n=1 Tax=Edwardsiella phage PEi26 TaxID=1608311 RepID=A0A0B6VRH8_9CAUD|nr:conserved hypothetical protein [Edwardsiella phage PEi26]